MKVVFLDIDGVLNSLDDVISHKKCDIWSHFLYNNVATNKVELLQKIINQTNAKIVVSSSWRYGFNTQYPLKTIKRNLMVKVAKKKMRVLRNKLSRYGMDIFDTTPYDSNYKYRGDEIREWLNNHPNTQKFIILDDHNDMCEFTYTNLIQTNYLHGLQQTHVDKAIQFLNQ